MLSLGSYSLRLPHAAGSQKLLQPRKLVMAGEVYRNLPFALGRLAEINLGAERRAEFLLERCDLFVPRPRHGPRVAFRIDDSQLVAVQRANAIADAGFGGTYGEPFLLDSSGEFKLLLLVAQRQKRPGVPLRDRALLDHGLHVRRQLKQADEIRERIQTDLAGRQLPDLIEDLHRAREERDDDLMGRS